MILCREEIEKAADIYFSELPRPDSTDVTDFTYNFVEKATDEVRQQASRKLIEQAQRIEELEDAIKLCRRIAARVIQK